MWRRDCRSALLNRFSFSLLRAHTIQYTKLFTQVEPAQTNTYMLLSSRLVQSVAGVEWSVVASLYFYSSSSSSLYIMLYYCFAIGACPMPMVRPLFRFLLMLYWIRSSSRGSLLSFSHDHVVIPPSFWSSSSPRSSPQRNWSFSHNTPCSLPFFSNVFPSIYLFVYSYTFYM